MLGLALGIREWSETFLEHLRYPLECLYKVHEQVKLRRLHVIIVTCIVLNSYIYVYIWYLLRELFLN